MFNLNLASIRETLARITIASYGGYTEQYLLSLAPFEYKQIDLIVSKIITPTSKPNT